MKNVMEIIDRKYGRYIMSAGRRYQAGVLEAEDIAQEVTIRLYESVTNGSIDLGNKSLVHSFILSRAIDLARAEIRQETLNLITEEEAELHSIKANEPTVVCSRVNTHDILEHLKIKLTDNQYKIIMELAFPSSRTQTKTENRLKGKTFRYINSTKGDVAKSLSVGPCTVSRAVTRAQAVLAPVI